MGAQFSSNKDYNRVLAAQTPTSINIPRLEAASEAQQTYDDTLLIPDPVRFSQNNRIEPSEASEQTLSLINTNPLPVVGKINPSPVFNRSPVHSQLAVQKIDRSFGASTFTYHQKMTTGAFVLSRSIISANDRHYANHFPPTIRSFRSLVERNGEQFLLEFEERIERRYVQCMDETTHRMRFFEVIDRIPCRVVRRRYENLHATYHDRFRQPALLPPTSNNRSNQSINALQPFKNQSSPSTTLANRLRQQTHTPSTLSERLIRSGTPSSISRSEITQTSTGSRTPVNRQMSSTQRPQASSTIPSAPPLPPNLNLNASQKPAIPLPPPPAPSTQFNSKNVRSNSSQDNKSNTPDKYTTIGSQAKRSFRPHTPTISEGRTSSSNSSHDSEEEDASKENATVDRTSGSKKATNGNYEQRTSRGNTMNSNGKANGPDSPTPVDPFARPKNPGDQHLYRRQPLARAYDEPIVNRRTLRHRNHPDYAPIPTSIKRTNNNEYAHRTNV